MGDAPIVPMEALLAHEGWLRRLARSLVLDDARADDLVQETWATALRRPPREGGSVRAWLASVVRSRAADARAAETRRTSREKDVAWRGEMGPGHDPVAQGAISTEIHRRLTRAVMELPEPYRSAVILRFFEGLPPRVVGARTGVPPETARTRVNRGVALLRERLDAEHGERRRWRALLIPVAGLGTPDSGPSSATAGGVAMASAKTVGSAVALLALCVGLWWWLRDDGAAAPRDTTESAAAPDAAEATARGARVRAKEEPAAPEATLAAPAPVPSGAAVRLRLLDEGGNELSADAARERWGGARAPAVALFDDRALRGSNRRDWMRQTVEGAGEALRTIPLAETGAAPSLKDRLPRGRWRLVVFPGGAASTITRPFSVSGDGQSIDVDVVLAATPMRTVRVVEPGKGGVAGAQLTPYFEFGDDDAFVAGPTIATDAAGEARLPVENGDPAAYRRPPTWWATTPSGVASFQVRPQGAAADTPLVVTLEPVCDVGGVARLADGSAAAGREVCWRKKGRSVETVCDASGHFVLHGIPATGMQQVFLIEDAERGVVRAGSVDTKPGATATMRFDPPPADSARIVVRVTAGGRPVEGAAVTCRGREGGLIALTDADGTAALRGIPAGSQPKVVVLLCDPRVLDDFTAVASVPALTSGEERRLSLNLPVGTLRVRVVSKDGSAVPGASVFARPADRGLPLPEGWEGKLGDGRFADDDGVAPLAGLPEGATCEIAALDGATGKRVSVTAIPGTPDAPAEVTLTLE